MYKIFDVVKKENGRIDYYIVGDANDKRKKKFHATKNQVITEARNGNISNVKLYDYPNQTIIKIIDDIEIKENVIDSPEIKYIGFKTLDGLRYLIDIETGKLLESNPVEFKKLIKAGVLLGAELNVKKQIGYNESMNKPIYDKIPEIVNVGVFLNRSVLIYFSEIPIFKSSRVKSNMCLVEHPLIKTDGIFIYAFHIDTNPYNDNKVLLNIFPLFNHFSSDVSLNICDIDIDKKNTLFMPLYFNGYNKNAGVDFRITGEYESIKIKSEYFDYFDNKKDDYYYYTRSCNINKTIDFYDLDRGVWVNKKGTLVRRKKVE